MTKKDILQKIIANKKAVGLSKKPKYATRKLSVGLVSCLLGYALLISPSSAQDLYQNGDVTKIGEEATESGDKNIANISNEALAKEKNFENNSLVSKKEIEDKQKDINDDKESFRLSDEQIKKLKDANFTEAEINLLVENIRQRLNNDKTFDVDGHIDDVIKTKVSAEKAIENTDDNNKNRIAEERAQDIEQVQKDAVYSPGQVGDTQSYSGTAYIYRKDRLNDVGQEPIGGVNVYLQWVDYDGYVSRVYKTTSRPDGTFTFNFQKPEVDKYGNIHHFQLAANPNFAIRTWVENPDKEKYSVVKPGDQKYGFHTRLNRINESWDFTAGLNRIVGGQVVLQEKPMKNDWLVKPKDEWSKAKSSDGIWENQGIYGNVRGQVWFENGDPKGSDARGWKKDSWDVNASGNEVVGSYVNDEMARLFDKWKEDHKDYKMEDFRKAQEELIRDYEAKNGKGSHIAETVYTKVDKDGNYYLPFRGLYGISPYKQNSGAKISYTISDEEYGKLVRDEDITHSNLMAWNGTVGQKHRHINWQYMYVSPLIKHYDLWGNTSVNNMFNDLSGTLLPIGPESLAGGNIRNVNFAFLAAQPMHDIKKYDTRNNYAKAGDVAENETGGLLPNHEYQIQWFRDGKKYGDPIKVTSDEKGLVGSHPLNIPKDLQGPHTFTSGVFYANADTSDIGSSLAADSFIASPEAIYDKVEKNKGEEAKTEAPKLLDNNGQRYTLDAEDSNPTYEYVERKVSKETDGSVKVEYKPLTTVKVGDKDIKVSVDPKTGVVSVSKEETAKLKDGDEIRVPVSIKYKNSMRINAEATIKIVDPLSLAANNEVKYEDVDGKVGDETRLKPIFTDKNGKSIDLVKDTKFKLGENAPEGAKVDEKTGEVTYTPKDGDYGKKVTIPVVAEYSDGTKDKADANIIVAKQEKSAPPEIDKIKEGDRKISGKGVAGSTILITKASENGDGDVISEDVKVDEKGNWHIDLPEDIVLKKGDQINASQIEVGKKISEPTARDVDLKDEGLYEPKTHDITKEFGIPTSQEEIKNAVEIPNYPNDKEKPKVAIDDLKQIPDGKTPGAYEVDVTVTYPDASEDKLKVKVIVKNQALPDVIERNALDNKETPNGYHRVTFKAGKGVKGFEKEIAYDVKDGKGLPEDKYPKAILEEGYENPTFSLKANTPITGNTEILASATEIEKAKVMTPSFEEVKEDSKEIKGKTDPKAKVSISVPGVDKPIETVADDEGNFKIELKEDIKLKDGDKITAQASDLTGKKKQSDIGETIVQKKDLPDLIDVTDNINSKTPDGYVRVTFEAGEGTEIPQAKTYDIKEGKYLKEEDYPTVHAKDGYENPTWSVKALEKITKDNAKIIASAKKKLTDKEKFTPKVRDLSTKVGEVPEANTAIENKTDLPVATKYEWIKKPEVSKAGESSGTVRVVYPDGTNDEVEVKVTVTEEIKDKDKYPVENPTKTKVADKDQLTPEEKKEVEEKVREKNQQAEKIEVGENGDAILTYPDGSFNRIASKDTVEEKTRIDDRHKTSVDPTDKDQGTGIVISNPNKDGSTKVSAKDEDGKNIEAHLDKESGEILVNPGNNVDGPITITVEDEDFSKGKEDIEIEVNSHAKGKNDNKTDAEKNPAQDPAKTLVVNKNKLTNEEKDKVKEKVKEKNPQAKDIVVLDNGDTTITYPDGSKNTIPGFKTVEEKTKTHAENIEPNIPAKTGVNNLDKLTDKERSEIEEKIKEANKGKFPQGTKVSIDEKGNATITYPDGSVDNITSDKLVRKEDKKIDLDESEKNVLVIPKTKTGVADLDRLTEKERAEIAEKVKKANPKAVEVRVDNKGNATVIYKDGSENSISKDKLVYKLNKVEVPDTNKNIQKQNSGSKTTKKSSNVKTGVASLTGVTTSLLLAIGSLFISKKKRD